MENIKVNNESVYVDLFMARGIINGDMKNNSDDFSPSSPIYKTTNETISHKEYIDAIKNRERVLSIIGSGDQIINTILFGAKDIVGVDISSFAKYFLALKLAAIESLSKEDYLEYFYGDKDNQFRVKYYFIIRDKLDDNTRLFWDNLYSGYIDHDIYNSSLFCNFNLGKKRVISNNPFLEDDNYKIVKAKLQDIKMELLGYDIFDIKKLHKGKFDLIILSNLINHIEKLYGNNITIEEYYNRFNEGVKKYKTFLHKLPLNIGGQAVTYNISFYPKIKDLFKENEYQVYPVKEDIKSCNIENEILVYKKERKIK